MLGESACYSMHVKAACTNYQLKTNKVDHNAIRNARFGECSLMPVSWVSEFAKDSPALCILRSASVLNVLEAL